MRPKQVVKMGLFYRVVLIIAGLSGFSSEYFEDASAGELTPVDLELVLAVDVSFSIGVDEHDAQRLGYVQAFRDPVVISAMTNGRLGRIAVTYIEWADAGFQHVVVPWTLVKDQSSAHRLAEDIEAAAVRRSGATSISSALSYAAGQFSGNQFRGDRRVIDISGDGVNNDGMPVQIATSRIAAAGVTINALPLWSEDADLSPEMLTLYYQECVTGGPGAFVLPAVSTADFALAMRRKLVAELANRSPLQHTAYSNARVWKAAARSTDCLIGEKRTRQEYIEMLRSLTNDRFERWAPDEKVWPSP